MLLEKTEKVAPGGMKRLNTSGNNAQLWMCLLVAVSLTLERAMLHRNLEC